MYGCTLLFFSAKLIKKIDIYAQIQQPFSMKILIIRFSSIGDIVLTTPVIRCLKHQTGAEIHYLTKKSFENILSSNPHIDRVFTIEKKVSEVIKTLKSMNYDYVIDLHKNFRSLQVKAALKAKSYSFDKLNVEKWLMVKLKINILPPKHIVDRYLETVSPLGVKNDGQGLDYFIPQEDNVDIATIQPKIKLPYIAFVIGAAHATKRLPVEKIMAICDKMTYPIVLLGGKEDINNGNLIASKSKACVVTLCGKLNLNQSASVIKQAHKVISHDTGLMHIAAAFHKDIVSIWGNTIPEFGMYPYLPKNEQNLLSMDWVSLKKASKFIEVDGLSCRPCSKIGHEACPKGHFKCMNLINTEEVIND
jgi:ADP-heptose:LPS heptosyltransferase